MAIWSSVVGVAAFGLATIGTSAGAAPLVLDPHFGDHMVLQRGRPVVVRGAGTAGAAVTVRFGAASVQTMVDRNSRWQAVLPAVVEGSGDLEVTESSGAALRLTDVVAGDVFLCSGQSNMDLPVSDTAYPRRTAEEGDGMPVRLLKIARTSSPRAERAIVTEAGWAHAGPQSLPAFSAACWHMARTLVGAGAGAPIGIIQASWGGASIEDWLDPHTLASDPVYRADASLLDRFAADPLAATAEVVASTDAWSRAADPDPVAQGYESEKFDDAGWSQINLPGSWERSGIDGLAAFDGLMWFRRDLVLTTDQAALPAVLHLGRIDERDQVWINGQAVGAGLVATGIRRYPIPAGLLQPGRNVVAIRVIDDRGGGGLMGKQPDLRLELTGADAVSLAGAWRYRTGAARRDWAGPPPSVPWTAPRGLGTMWNGMIAPLDGFPLKGIAWYQGETNTADAEAYAGLLRVWAASWRRFFGDPDLPLVVAQLPGYGPRSATPSDGEWPRLREAQRLTADADPRMGLAVLIDLGVSHDIHPAHKEVVGKRLGNEMLRLAYGRDVAQAPEPSSARLAPDGVRVVFANTKGQLAAYGSHDAAGFELCDAASRCRFVAARVDGDAVVLPADRGAVMVRYAWQGSPPVNLFGADGLPVAPFGIAISPPE